VTLEELNEVAAKWFTPNDYQIIVVGDAATLKNSLESLNIPVEVLEISK
jgi:zinc protease